MYSFGCCWKSTRRHHALLRDRERGDVRGHFEWHYLSGCIGMRMVIRGKSNDAPDEDHLLFELALIVVLGKNFPIEVEEFL
jgi:hypothetical protein